MVEWWAIQIDKGIALTKMRIKHDERHGVGASAMKEKAILQKQEKHKKDRLEKL